VYFIKVIKDLKLDLIFDKTMENLTGVLHRMLQKLHLIVS